MRACPACGEELLPIGPAEERTGYRANVKWFVIGCPRCGGVWTDNTASQRVASSLDPEIVGAAVEAEEHAAQVGAPLPDDSKPRVCPECGGGLARVVSMGTRLDVCAQHGTWFDRGELWKVARALEHKRRLADPTWKSSEDMRWVSGSTSLNKGDPMDNAFSNDVEEDDLLVEAFTWVAKKTLDSMKGKK